MSLKDYALLGRVGEGTFGEVFKAIHVVSGITVALKKIRFQHNSAGHGLPKSVLREIQALLAVQHPNVVRLYTYFPSGSSVTLAMEYLPNDLYKTIRALTERVQPLCERQIKAIMHMLLKGIAAMHIAGIIHRDLKPSNLLFSRTGALKIADFGQARSWSRTPAPADASHTPVSPPARVDNVPSSASHQHQEQQRSTHSEMGASESRMEAASPRVPGTQPSSAAPEGDPRELSAAVRSGTVFSPEAVSAEEPRSEGTDTLMGASGVMSPLDQLDPADKSGTSAGECAHRSEEEPYERERGSSGHLTPEVATRWYRAPELLFGSRTYTSAVDIWAVGCILAELLNNGPLFPGENDIDQLSRVVLMLGVPSLEDWPGLLHLPDYGKITFPDHKPVPFKQIVPDASTQARSLLESLLVFDPDKRLSATEALKHRFFCTPPLADDENDMLDLLTSLRARPIQTGIRDDS